MMRRWSWFHESSGKTFLRSRSTCSTDLPGLSFHRIARRWICVSTGNAGTPKAWAMTTEAVLWPTPGSSSSSSKVRGTSPACFVMISFARPTSALDFCGASPSCLIRFRTFSTGSAAIFAGVPATANKAGVTSLTFLSVHCAESTTATSKVKASVWSSGTGVSG